MSKQEDGEEQVLAQLAEVVGCCPPLARHHRAWGPQVSALRDRYRVVTVDLRTHGASPAPGGFRFDDAVADVVDLLEVLRPRRLALVGLSLGGNIAQEVVRRAPERVDALPRARARRRRRRSGSWSRAARRCCPGHWPGCGSSG